MNNNFIYKDFTYKDDFEIEHSHDIPESLYKYYNNNPFSREALIQNYLFCSHPFHLNDSLDGASVLLDISEISKDRFEKFLKRYSPPLMLDYEKEKALGFINIKKAYILCINKPIRNSLIIKNAFKYIDVVSLLN